MSTVQEVTNEDADVPGTASVEELVTQFANELGEDPVKPAEAEEEKK